VPAQFRWAWRPAPFHGVDELPAVGVKTMPRKASCPSGVVAQCPGIGGVAVPPQAFHAKFSAVPRMGAASGNAGAIGQGKDVALPGCS
jgi:hypothetical protein